MFSSSALKFYEFSEQGLKRMNKKLRVISLLDLFYLLFDIVGETIFEAFI